MFNIQIKDTPNRGRGVFATKNYTPGETIEICPVIIMTPEESKYYDETILGNYLYEWKDENDAALILGYGLIYNHSYSPNAEYKRNFTNNEMLYVAIKNIDPGDEILVNYNGDPESQDKIDWFEVK